ncbi:MAG: glycosyltransferase [Planctomycetaceae bacterium]|nr:glycosyltransferase [Planctomycetaceae bacterium]
MEQVKVSVCMITFNQERYIAQAINSVLEQQTTFPFEIVIGEDCSTDGTRAIVEQLAAAHPQVIRLRLAEQNQGAKRNFVGTFSEARGEFVVILEGDDYFTDPLKLQRQVAALVAHPDWSICFHPARCLYEGNLQGPPVTPERWDREEATIVDLFEQNFIPTSGAMFRNRGAESLPDWFMDAEAGDWALHLLNAAHGNIGFLPEVMSAYRIHPAGTWSGRSVEARVVSIFHLLSAVDHHFGGRFAEHIERNRVTTVRWLFGEWNNAAETSRKAVELLSVMTTGETPRKRVTLGKGRGHSRKEIEQLAEMEPGSQDYQSLACKLEALLDERAWLREAHREWTSSLAYKVSRELKRPWNQLRTFFRSRRSKPLALPDDPAPPAAKAA